LLFIKDEAEYQDHVLSAFRLWTIHKNMHIFPTFIYRLSTNDAVNTFHR